MSQESRGNYATVNGLAMYYEIHGTGKPLLLIHGSFGMVAGWGTILPELVKTRQVIIVELQGHGHTADRDKPLEFEQLASDVAQLLQQLNLTGIDVFGYSMGGTVALALTIHYPELVGKLAILGSSARSAKETYEPESYRQYQSIPDDFAPPVLKDPYDRTAPDPTHWPVLVRKVREMEPNFVGFTDNEMKSIEAPVLILQGDKDGVRPEHAVEMYRFIPNAQLAIFPGGDHFMLFHSPAKVLATILPFFDTPNT